MLRLNTLYYETEEHICLRDDMPYIILSTSPAGHPSLRSQHLTSDIHPPSSPFPVPRRSPTPLPRSIPFSFQRHISIHPVAAPRSLSALAHPAPWCASTHRDRLLD